MNGERLERCHLSRGGVCGAVNIHRHDRLIIRPMTRVLALCTALFAAVRAFAADPLPAHDADVTNITVSGVSAGGYMAVQFHVAHADRVKGVGVIAGGPYYCALGSLWTAWFNCMTPTARAPLPSVAALKAHADALAKAQAIAPPAQLATARVWLFAGTQDRTVAADVVEALRDFYAGYVPAQNIALVRDKPAGHGMVTEDAGVACSATQTPYINDCDYDAAGALLAHTLGPLAARATKESGRVLRFDQAAIASGNAYAIGMADSGFAYVPRACETERCRVHVAFHGCRQSVEAIGEQFVRQAGYNRWADTNRLTVLYPQTIARYGLGFRSASPSFIYNPRGCWDWWGYAGPQYHTRSGAQIRAVKAMVDRLGAPRGR
jgi:poly(3-hydroxybutyrate) depolymerase